MRGKNQKKKKHSKKTLYIPSVYTGFFFVLRGAEGLTERSDEKNDKKFFLRKNFQRSHSLSALSLRSLSFRSLRSLSLSAHSLRSLTSLIMSDGILAWKDSDEYRNIVTKLELETNSTVSPEFVESVQKFDESIIAFAQALMNRATSGHSQEAIAELQAQLNALSCKLDTLMEIHDDVCR